VRKPAENYRDMLRKEMSVFRAVTEPSEIVQCLTTYGEEALNYDKYPYWTEDERAARLIWSGLGFFILGCIDCLDSVLAIIVAFPAASEHKVCRYYIPAIDCLLPLPDHLSIKKDPSAIRDWVRSHYNELSWDEHAGKIVYAQSQDASKPIVIGRNARIKLPDEGAEASSPFVRWLSAHVSDVERQALVTGWKPHTHNASE
jgi:hypothetical protein